jgi:integrase
MLAALTGMRRGELCALRWSDVNLDVGVLDVSRSLVVAPGGLAEKSTKTDRSRKVALDPVGIQDSVDTPRMAAGVELPTVRLSSP